MEFKIKSKDGVKLLTSGKYCEEDLNIVLDESLIPSGTLEVTENGEHDVTSYEKVNVAVAGSGESTLKKLLDVTKSTKNMFSDNTTITDLTGLIDYNDTENVENMEKMFFRSNITKIPNMNTKKVTSMYYFCYDCKELNNYLKLETPNVTLLSYLAYGCKLLPIIDLSYFKSSSTDSMVANCWSLKAIVIRGFGGSYNLYSNATSGCLHFEGKQDDTYNPNGDKDGYFYVPRAMIETLKSKTNWSKFADQYRALEDYTLDGTTTGELDLSKMGLE